MALPRTFTFTAADGTDLVTYDSAFAYSGAGLNAIDVVSNAVKGNGASVENIAVVNAETFNNNQYSQGVVAVALNGRLKGLCARMDGSGNGYVWYGAGPASYGNMYMMLEILRVPTQIGTYGASFAPTKTARMECNGTTIIGIFDGTTRVSVTDATYSSGKAGLAFRGSGGAANMDDLEVGNLTSTATSDIIGTIRRRTINHSILVR